jgi:predicted unusual protein kinase regulating ubiquinone biosynthesis (AarF/ABC1/UbiB family)
MAQMLSMDTTNLGSAFTDAFQKAQYSVPPMSAPLAVQAFTKSIGKPPEQVFDKFNAQAIRAASMGQVHEAWLGGQRLAVKIQYPGVADAIRSDMRMVKQFAPAVVKASAKEMEPYFEEVEGKLLEESNYALELTNSLAFRAACADLPGVTFPEYFPEFSGDRVLTMSWLPGLHLRDWLTSEPTEEAKHQAALNLWNLYDFQVHVLRAVNADPHPGNFLFQPDGSIGVLDFGCTKRIGPDLYADYFALADPALFTDLPALTAAMYKLEILRPTDSPEKVSHLMALFTELIGLITSPLHAERFDFNQAPFYERVSEIGKEIAAMREVRGSKDFLFVNRAFFGLYTMLQQLEANIPTRSPNFTPGRLLAPTRALA